MLHQSDIGQRLICEWMTSQVLMFKVICKVKMTEKYPKMPQNDYFPTELDKCWW